MIVNTSACTVWEMVVQNRSPTYVRHQTGAAYWEDTTGAEAGKDRSPDNKALILIHESKLGDYMPKPDDRIMRGAVDSASPPPSSLTVKAVKDFLYGSASVRHIEISAV